MYLGSAWYPEHWPESRWEKDLQLMQAAGLTVARIGEYTWSRIEPREGQFEIDWLVRAVDLAAKFDVKIVMGTPTDAPPAWLTQKYPDVLRVDENGKTLAHGARRHFSPFSPRYRELCRRIVERMADRFGKHANVLGWQIGNEFCMYSYDEAARTFFQQWLAQRYGTIENLNSRWSGSYWSEEYSDWSQILPPSGWANPGLNLEYFRFMSEGFAQFQQVQIDAIRARAASSQWITHNIHGWEDLDFTRIIEGADLASWDPYPGGAVVDYAKFGWTSDFCRTLKPRPHWIMETQPGNVNWKNPNVTLPRGAIRGLAWHFLAHGAAAVLFWQWRAALNGQEQLHGTIVAADGNPRPIYGEVSQVAKELRKVESLLRGTKPAAQVAVLYSYADQYCLKHQRHHHDFDPLRHLGEFYAPLREMALEVDVLDTRWPIDEYRLVVAPHLQCLDDALVRKLVAYVEAGGHLLLGPRSGFKDQFNAMLESRQPGKELSELLGAQVEEFYTLDRNVPVSGELGSGEAMIWAELLEPASADAKVLLRYGAYNGWIDGKPAMVSRAAGRGRITYLGAWLAPEVMGKVMGWAAGVSGIKCEFPRPPEHVEVCHRKGDNRELFLVVNHSGEPQRVSLPRPLTDALTGQRHEKAVELPGYGVAVLTKAD